MSPSAAPERRRRHIVGRSCSPLCRCPALSLRDSVRSSSDLRRIRCVIHRGDVGQDGHRSIGKALEADKIGKHGRLARRDLCKRDAQRDCRAFETQPQFQSGCDGALCARALLRANDECGEECVRADAEANSAGSSSDTPLSFPLVTLCEPHFLARKARAPVASLVKTGSRGSAWRSAWREGWGGTK
jgi:hypothetical protein